MTEQMTLPKPVFDDLLSQNSSDDLGIYIHVPFCKHECPYCDFYKFSIKSKPSNQRTAYLNQIFSELNLWGEKHPEIFKKTMSTIYFGGGTPGILPSRKFSELLSIISSALKISNDVEITLEANPENCTESNLANWAEAGINRLSLGVQSFQATQLKKLERLHTPEVLLGALSRISESKIENFSLDLMFGLPNQTLSDFESDLDQALKWKPNHISLYGLTFHEGTPFYEELQSGKISQIDNSIEAEMYLLAKEKITALGLEHYEVSSYAKPGYKSNHNQRYWYLKDVLGLGPGAASSMGNIRFQNPENIDQWAAEIQSKNLCFEITEQLTNTDRTREKLLAGFRCSSGISLSDFPNDEHAIIAWLNEPIGQQCQREGWIIADANLVKLTVEGWLRSNPILYSLNEFLDNHSNR